MSQPNRVDRPRVIVAGGSLGGLAAGLELLSAGCDVSVFERSGRVLDDRGAGIVMQAETFHLLRKYKLADEHTAGVWSRFRQYLDGNGEGRPTPSQQLMTSWGLLYGKMRSAFPAERYHEDRAVTGFEADVEGVRVTSADGRTERADLLVGADGSRSTLRQRLFPEVKPSYSGYVAWRGVIPEAEAGSNLLGVFADRFTFFQMEQSHILCYLIPGPAGEVEPGQRRLNWVWYWNVPDAELRQVMIGRDGRERDFSVPPGQARPEVVEAQRKVARTQLAKPFADLVEATADPFVQPILDLAVPKMVVGRVCLVGDAAFIPRPHTAASTSKAVGNAIALGQAVADRPGDLDAALAAWEPGQLEIGRDLERHGKLLGDRSQFPLR
jgi:2-polyprenyl-6-methoxyphenol hydroxylase-like FAD-dependent oxidoreductase